MKREKLYYDVVVVGGGTAGIAAALAASNGNRVLIIERSYVLGGAATIGQVTPRMSTYVDGFETMSLKYISDSANKMCKNDYNNEHAWKWFDPVLLRVLLDKIIGENGVSVLFGTTLVDAHVENGKISFILAKALDTIYYIYSKHFIDASGDALLASACSCQVEHGDERGKGQNISLRFNVGNVNISHLREFLMANNYKTKNGSFSFLWKDTDSFMFEMFKKAVQQGEIAYEDAIYIQTFISPVYGEGIVYFNCPESPIHKHSTNAFEVSQAVAYCRESAYRLWNFFKKNFPGFEKSNIISFADYPGVRDGNRIVGKYVLTEDDCYSSRKFNDAIAQCAYPIDVHGSESLTLIHKKVGEYYEIPFRCLQTNEILNLAVVGRCISTTFLAQSSTRIQAVCIATGEAAGLATLICQDLGVQLNEIDGQMVKEKMKQYGTTFKENKKMED